MPCTCLYGRNPLHRCVVVEPDVRHIQDYKDALDRSMRVWQKEFEPWGVRTLFDAREEVSDLLRHIEETASELRRQLEG